MHIISEKDGKIIGLETKEIKLPLTALAEDILQLLAQNQAYPKQIAKQLNVHEQKVYYHIRVLEKLGFIHMVRKEEHGGVMAKIYSITKPSFFVRFKDFDEYTKIPKNRSSFLSPFIENGELNAKIIVGSPDPHGPEHARSRDAYLGVDLGLFLGTFLRTAKPTVFLDTDVRKEDLDDNIILIGGPVINRISKRVNDSLPVRFDAKKRIYSSLTKKTYANDENGFIVKCANPFCKEKQLLIIAGRRYSGTRAAVLAFTQCFEEISKTSKGKHAHIVEGIDEDSDGVIDSVKILE